MSVRRQTWGMVQGSHHTSIHDTTFWHGYNINYDYIKIDRQIYKYRTPGEASIQIGYAYIVLLKTQRTILMGMLNVLTNLENDYMLPFSMLTWTVLVFNLNTLIHTIYYISGHPGQKYNSPTTVFEEFIYDHIYLNFCDYGCLIE